MKILIFFLVLFFVLDASAQLSPVGLWRTVDDSTGKTRALVRISDEGGELVGRIEKLFIQSGEDPQPVCSRCDGANKNQPVLGMVILRGLRRSGDEYIGGEILDPETGSVYRSKIKLAEGNSKLNVRGYIGIPLIGRTQTWIREF